MIRVLLSNVGALLKDKFRRLGAANQPESDEAAARVHELKRSPSVRSLSSMEKSKDEQNENENREEMERKTRLLFGKAYKK